VVPKEAGELCHPNGSRHNGLNRRPKRAKGFRVTLQLTLMVRTLAIVISLDFGRLNVDDDYDDEYEQPLEGMRGGCSSS
jgi:hypothetical protein